MTNIEATKQELKEAIDRAIAAAADYNRAIADLNLPELPIELIEFGDPKYNQALEYLSDMAK